ncbi:MAG: SDR family oxidoreductase [Polyangiales bacterium]
MTFAGENKALVRVHTCDVESDQSVRAFAGSIGEGPVDLLINNAGVMGKRTQSLEDLDLDDVMKTFSINALGAIRVSRALLPRIRESDTRKIAHVTSQMGSIGDNSSGGAYAYRMSKAALNMASKSMAVDLRQEKVMSVVLNPGWVKTDMGGDQAPTSLSDSVRGMLRVIDSITLEKSGEFFDFRGTSIEW